MDYLKKIRRNADIASAIGQYRPGQVLELHGYCVRVYRVVPPDEYRDYGLLYLEGPRGNVPWVIWARVDEDGLNFEVTEGWLD